jgi:hypothetical protein
MLMLILCTVCSNWNQFVIALHALQALLCNANKWLRLKLRQAPTATGEFHCGTQTADCARLIRKADTISPSPYPEHHQARILPAKFTTQNCGPTTSHFCSLQVLALFCCYSHTFTSKHNLLFRGVGWDSPLCTPAAVQPIVPVPDDRWVWSLWWGENW